MRTNTISTTVITYPEDVIWLHDSNVIKLDSQYKVGAQVIITEPTGNIKTLAYFSKLKSLLFTLDDALKALFTDNISAWNIRVLVYENGMLAGSFGFDVKVLNGKSFITRSHGMAQTIYVYSSDDLSKLTVYSPAAGEVAVGTWGFTCYPGLNAYNLQSVITSEGEYSLCLNDSDSTPSHVNIVNDIAVDPNSSVLYLSITPGTNPNAKTGGDIWREEKQIFPICHKIIYEERCDGFDFAELRYTDTDGCIRYLGGKLLNEQDNAEDAGWSTLNTDVWKHKPCRWIQSSDKVVKIGFTDIEKNAYPSDILYSDSIQLKIWDGTWQDVRLKTNSLDTTNDEYMDFELELYAHEL